VFIKKLKDCKKFISGDKAVLRELLNARKGRFSFNYSLAHAIVKLKHKTRPHRLKTSEVYYILEGSGRMHIDAQSAKVTTGDTVYIPPKAVQYIENIGRTNLVFLCIVDPAWRIQDEEIIQGNQKEGKMINDK
jgi:mannose-6-phosphate isomerase-like protein (cupin superfamily)